MKIYFIISKTALGQDYSRQIIMNLILFLVKKLQHFLI